MPTISGKNGFVSVYGTQVNEVLNWTLDKEFYTTRYGSSLTSGFKASVIGVGSATGTVEMKYDMAAPTVIPDGTYATLKLYLDSTHFYLVPAAVKNQKIKCDQDDGAAISATADFESMGAWTEPTLP